MIVSDEKLIIFANHPASLNKLIGNCLVAFQANAYGGSPQRT